MLPAGADHLAGPVLLALGVGAAGRRRARVEGAAALKGVAAIAGQAAAVLAHLTDLALGVLSAGTGLTERHQRLLDRNTSLRSIFEYSSSKMMIY